MSGPEDSSPDAEVLNAAFLRYVATFPAREWLWEFIHERGLQSSVVRIKAELDGLLRTAENHLFDYPGGVPWDEAFGRAYRDFLKQEHPWISDETIQRVFSFSQWLCWHEGLNRQG